MAVLAALWRMAPRTEFVDQIGRAHNHADMISFLVHWRGLAEQWRQRIHQTFQ